MADARAVRTALYSWAFNVNRRDEEPPDEVARVLDWFERKSCPHRRWPIACGCAPPWTL